MRSIPFEHETDRVPSEPPAGGVDHGAGFADRDRVSVNDVAREVALVALAEPHRNSIPERVIHQSLCPLEGDGRAFRGRYRATVPAVTVPERRTCTTRQATGATT
jgi:hypothetical protein